MSWDDEAAGWDENPAVRAYGEAAFRSLQEALGDRDLAGMRVLDFGCGTGLLAEKLATAGAEVVALDISPAMVAVLRRKVADRGLSRITPLVGELDGFVADGVLAPGSFDLVVASSVLAFVPELDATVASLAALLVPGGLLVHFDWVLDPAAEEPFGLGRDAIEAAHAGAGLALELDIGFEEPFEGMTMAPWRAVGRR